MATNLADASQGTLRGGANRLVRDLIEAGRGIPTGGIPIPNGAGGSANRPSPPGLAYLRQHRFDDADGDRHRRRQQGPVIDMDARRTW